MTERSDPAPDTDLPANADEATTTDEPTTSPALGLGAALVVIGLLLFAGQALDIGIDDVGWPFMVVAVGVVILALGLFLNREQGMVVGGTVVTTVGLVLAYQNATDHWQSWAYAWALVGPAASGLGLALWGARTGNGTDLRNGTWGVLGGLGLFVVGYLFFEGVIGISGQRLPIPDWVLPAAAIAIGAAMLGRALFERRNSTA